MAPGGYAFQLEEVPWRYRTRLYVGFWTDYGRFQLGLSEKRARWVVKVIEELESAEFLISGRAFTELLGRLGFASQAVPWIRPTELATARWFSFEVLANDAPWLYYRGADVQKMSTAAEMLASYAALHAFGHLQRDRNEKRYRGVALIAAGTDNLANEYLRRG